MRITSKGQVTIPKDLRDRFGLLPDTEVEFLAEESGVRIVKARGRGSGVVDRLRGTADGGLSTDEIMALTRGAT